MIFSKLLCFVNLVIAYQSNGAARSGIDQPGKLNSEPDSNLAAKLDEKFKFLDRHKELNYEQDHLTWNMKNKGELDEFKTVISSDKYFDTQLAWYLLNWYQRTKGNNQGTIEQKVTFVYNNVENTFTFGTDQVKCEQQLCIDPFSQEEEENNKLLKSIKTSYSKYFEDFKNHHQEYPFNRIPNELFNIPEGKSIDEAGKQLDEYIKYYIRIVTKKDSKRALDYARTSRQIAQTEKENSPNELANRFGDSENSQSETTSSKFSDQNHQGNQYRINNSYSPQTIRDKRYTQDGLSSYKPQQDTQPAYPTIQKNRHTQDGLENRIIKSNSPHYKNIQVNRHIQSGSSSHQESQPNEDDLPSYQTIQDNTYKQVGLSSHQKSQTNSENYQGAQGNAQFNSHKVNEVIDEDDEWINEDDDDWMDEDDEGLIEDDDEDLYENFDFPQQPITNS